MERALASIRQAATKVFVDRVVASGAVDDIVVCTDTIPLTGLSQQVEIIHTPGEFHLGNMVTELVMQYQWDTVLVAGGASVPLATAGFVAEIVDLARAESPAVVVNNPVSTDIFVVSPAKTLQSGALPASDNFIGFLLAERGLQRIVVDDRIVPLDIDTPTDAILVAHSPDADERIVTAVRELGWPQTGIDKWVAAVNKPWAEVCIIGRVAPGVVQFLNTHFNWRTRVYSEERGMKALGREDGSARSIIGEQIRLMGSQRFVDALSECCDACLFDTRVVFAHSREMPVPADRYWSDLGRVDMIQDELVREFTLSIQQAPIPILLGGHGLVSGGVRLLAQQVMSTAVSGVVRQTMSKE